MFSWYHAYRIEKQRRDEEAAQAAEERLIGNGNVKIGLGVARGARFYHWTLNRMGGVLVLWGRRLQSNYEQWAAFQGEEASWSHKPDPCA